MISVKVQCSCGQKYAFEVEPVNGRLPQPVNCPTCGADGTAAANEVIAQQLSRQTASPPPPRPTTAPPVDKRPKSKLAVCILAGVGCIALIAAGAGVIWWKHNATAASVAQTTPLVASQTKTAAPSAIPEQYRYRHPKATLPPEVAAFVAAKEKQAHTLVQKQGLKLDPAVQGYFDALKAGRIGESQQLHYDSRFNKESHPQLEGPLGQLLIDVVLTADALGESQPDLFLALGRAMTNSLSPGCIYFGGTDPGRGLPTLLCGAPGDPFFVVSQNVLCDGRYLELLRQQYGSRIRLPTTNEVAQCSESYCADVLKRKEAGRLMPGEDVVLKDGKPQVQGQIAVMSLNALIARQIFEKNGECDFYVEESYPLQWMYPYLLPHGLLMKLNREPLELIPAQEIQQDRDFWSRQLADKIGDWLTPDTPLSNICAFAERVFGKKDFSGFTGDRRFIGDKYSVSAYSKLRSSIGGVYAWRLNPDSRTTAPQYRPKTAAQSQELSDAADFAFKQAFAICPSSPEAVFRYAQLLLQQRRFEDALLVAETSLKVDSGNGQVRGLVENVRAYKKQSAGP
jgi:hypothetical protein